MEEENGISATDCTVSTSQEANKVHKRSFSSDCKDSLNQAKFEVEEETSCDYEPSMNQQNVEEEQASCSDFKVHRKPTSSSVSEGCCNQAFIEVELSFPSDYKASINNQKLEEGTPCIEYEGCFNKANIVLTEEESSGDCRLSMSQGETEEGEEVMSSSGQHSDQLVQMEQVNLPFAQTPQDFSHVCVDEEVDPHTFKHQDYMNSDFREEHCAEDFYHSNQLVQMEQVNLPFAQAPQAFSHVCDDAEMDPHTFKHQDYMNTDMKEEHCAEDCHHSKQLVQMEQVNLPFAQAPQNPSHVCVDEEVVDPHTFKHQDYMNTGLKEEPFAKNYQDANQFLQMEQVKSLPTQAPQNISYVCVYENVDPHTFKHQGNVNPDLKEESSAKNYQEQIKSLPTPASQNFSYVCVYEDVDPDTFKHQDYMKSDLKEEPSAKNCQHSNQFLQMEKVKSLPTQALQDFSHVCVNKDVDPHTFKHQDYVNSDMKEEYSAKNYQYSNQFLQMEQVKSLPTQAPQDISHYVNPDLKEESSAKYYQEQMKSLSTPAPQNVSYVCVYEDMDPDTFKHQDYVNPDLKEESSAKNYQEQVKSLPTPAPQNVSYVCVYKDVDPDTFKHQDYVNPDLKEKSSAKNYQEQVKSLPTQASQNISYMCVYEDVDPHTFKHQDYVNPGLNEESSAKNYQHSNQLVQMEQVTSLPTQALQHFSHIACVDKEMDPHPFKHQDYMNTDLKEEPSAKNCQHSNQFLQMEQVKSLPTQAPQDVSHVCVDKDVDSHTFQHQDYVNPDLKEESSAKNYQFLQMEQVKSLPTHAPQNFSYVCVYEDVDPHTFKHQDYVNPDLKEESSAKNYQEQLKSLPTQAPQTFSYVCVYEDVDPHTFKHQDYVNPDLKEESSTKNYQHSTQMVQMEQVTSLPTQALQHLSHIACVDKEMDPHTFKHQDYMNTDLKEEHGAEDFHHSNQLVQMEQVNLPFAQAPQDFSHVCVDEEVDADTFKHQDYVNPDLKEESSAKNYQHSNQFLQMEQVKSLSTQAPQDISHVCVDEEIEPHTFKHQDYMNTDFKQEHCAEDFNHSNQLVQMEQVNLPFPQAPQGFSHVRDDEEMDPHTFKHQDDMNTDLKQEHCAEDFNHSNQLVQMEQVNLPFLQAPQDFSHVRDDEEMDPHTFKHQDYMNSDFREEHCAEDFHHSNQLVQMEQVNLPFAQAPQNLSHVCDDGEMDPHTFKHQDYMNTDLKQEHCAEDFHHSNQLVQMEQVNLPFAQAPQNLSHVC